MTKDSETGESVLRHRMSPTTGRYRGRVVVDMTAKLAKKEEKRKRREQEAAQMGEPVREKEEAEDTKVQSDKDDKVLDPQQLSQK